MVEVSMSDIGAILDKAEEMGMKVGKLESVALKAGAQPILQEAKDNIRMSSPHHIGSKEFQKSSIESGALFNSLQVGTPKKDMSKGGKYIKVYSDDPVAHLVEFGHAGPAPAPAHPFMAPAYENKKEEAKKVVIETLKAGLGL